MDKKTYSGKCDGLYIAASMNGMPHGSSGIEGNNFLAILHPLLRQPAAFREPIGSDHQRAVMQALRY